MITAQFNAFCPFEIGDKLLDQSSGRVHTITDIMCVHRVKTGTVKFRYELNNSGRFVELECVKRQEKPSTRSMTLVAADESGTLPPDFVRFIKKRFG